MKILFTLFLVLVATLTQAQNTLTITLKNKIKDEGQILVALFNSSAEFLQKPAIALSFPISEDGKYEIKNIPTGEYALSVVHDVDNSGKLEFESNGRPVEPYGFSNSPPSTFGPPSYSDAKFVLDKDTTMTVNVQ